MPERAKPQIFDTRTQRYFGDARVPLTTYLRTLRPVPAGPQHFCIVGYDHGPDSNGTVVRIAQVHWREGGRLIAWPGATDPESARDAIRFSSRDLDLRTDMVATDADVGSSTYLVTRAWVAGVLADCAARGTRYTVTVRRGLHRPPRRG